MQKRYPCCDCGEKAIRWYMLGGSDLCPGNILMVTGPGWYTRVSKLEARMRGQKHHS